MSASWSTPSCVLLVLAILLGAALAKSLPAAVYLLSFWHYGLYWLAFAFGASRFDVFKRNAIGLKAVSVTALAVVYLSAPIDPASLAVILGVERLFCNNERAVIRTRLAGGHLVTLVPVAAILVASIRLHFLDVAMNKNYRGAGAIDCDATFNKGDELGWFKHGSTIIVFAPPGFQLCVREGTLIRMGRALMRLR